MAIHLGENRCQEGPVFNVPFPRNKFFTGREEVLNRLYKNFNGSERTQALNGLGGIGKTQTAVEYSYRHRQEYEVVLWAGANTRETLVADYAAMAGLLDLPENNAQDRGEAVAAVKRWLENNSNWLLILDNADEIKIAREFIPSCETGRILLTTRAHTMGPVGESNTLEKMSPEEGALFLLRRLRMLKKDGALESATTEICVQAEALSSLVDGLPLALDQAAAFIEETPSSIKEYQELYRAERLKLLNARGEFAEGHPESVAVTFSLAFKKVEKANPATADLLRVCAFFEADSIPEEIFSEGAKVLGEALGPAAESSLVLTTAIGEAARFSLLWRNPDTQTVSLHRLVQAVLRDEMDDDTGQVWAERAVRAVNEAFPDVEYSNWPSCDRLIRQAQALAPLIEKYGFDFREAARLLSRAGYYLNGRAQYAEAEPVYRRALDIREKALGAEHPDVATSLNNLAEFYRNQRKYAEAEPLFVRALAIYEKALGAEHPYVATSLNNLALLYKNQGRYAEAEPLFVRALAIFEKALGAEHPYVATSLNNLAAIYNNQWKYAEAEPFYRRALATYEKALGVEHPYVATVLGNYSSLLRAMDRESEAEKFENRASIIKAKNSHQDSDG